MKVGFVAVFISILIVFPASASDAAIHEDPVASVVLSLTVILLASKLGGHLAVLVGQPSVLGELLFGVLLGNLPLVGISVFEYIKHDAGIDLLARLGVLILLFEVGLESTVQQMMKVGFSSLLVAVLGVAVPFIFGCGVGAWLLPESGRYVHLFLGATLCATSVGITARVLKDLNKSQSGEARIILGAAVIDDVLGLVILAVVSGSILAVGAGAHLSVLSAAAIFGKAILFLSASLILGVLFTPKLFSLASRLQTQGVLLAVGLSFCFLLAWMADKIGLAAIVGAFAAGLILEDLHYRDFKTKGEHPLEELIHPISSFLVPVFFVFMGLRTDLRPFAQLEVLGLAAVLTIAAIIGKQACSLGVIGKEVDRLSIGIGMIPRGEVGLIFANIGMGLSIQGQPIVSQSTYSAIVVMVIVTTLITPPALKWSMSRRR